MYRFSLLPRVLIEGYNGDTLLFSYSGKEYQKVNPTGKDKKLIELISCAFFYNFDAKKYLRRSIFDKETEFYEITDKEELVLKFSVPKLCHLVTVIKNQFVISSTENKEKNLELWGDKDGKFVKLHSKVTFPVYNEFSEQLIRSEKGNIKLYCFGNYLEYITYYVRCDEICGPIGNRILDKLTNINFSKVLILNSSQILIYGDGLMSFITDGNITQRIELTPSGGLQNTGYLYFNKISSTCFIVTSFGQWLKFYTFDGTYWELTQTLELELEDIKGMAPITVKILTQNRDDFLKFAKLLPIDCLPLDLKVMTSEFCVAT